MDWTGSRRSERSLADQFLRFAEQKIGDDPIVPYVAEIACFRMRIAPGHEVSARLESGARSHIVAHAMVRHGQNCSRMNITDRDVAGNLPEPFNSPRKSALPIVDQSARNDEEIEVTVRGARIDRDIGKLRDCF